MLKLPIGHGQKVPGDRTMTLENLLWWMLWEMLM